MLVLLGWACMPVTTPHSDELYQKQPAQVELFKPTEALQKTEKLIAQANSAVQALEAKNEARSREEGQERGGRDWSSEGPAIQSR